MHRWVGRVALEVRGRKRDLQVVDRSSESPAVEGGGTDTHPDITAAGAGVLKAVRHEDDIPRPGPGIVRVGGEHVGAGIEDLDEQAVGRGGLLAAGLVDGGTGVEAYLVGDARVIRPGNGGALRDDVVLPDHDCEVPRVNDAIREDVGSVDRVDGAPSRFSPARQGSGERHCQSALVLAAVEVSSRRREAVEIVGEDGLRSAGRGEDDENRQRESCCESGIIVCLHARRRNGDRPREAAVSIGLPARIIGKSFPCHRLRKTHKTESGGKGRFKGFRWRARCPQ